MKHDDHPLPSDSEGFDRYFETSLASMAPDIDPALLSEIMPQVNEWRLRQAEPPSRTAAIRHLINLGLQTDASNTQAPAARLGANG